MYKKAHTYAQIYGTAERIWHQSRLYSQHDKCKCTEDKLYIHEKQDYISKYYSPVLYFFSFLHKFVFHSSISQFTARLLREIKMKPRHNICE